jgi:hypothetical protein
MEPDMEMERRHARGGGEPTDGGAFDSEVLADAPLRADAADIRAVRAAVLREGRARGGRKLPTPEPEPLGDEYEYEWPGVRRRSHRRWFVGAAAIVAAGVAVLGAATVAREPIERVVASVRGAVASARGEGAPSVTEAVADADVEAPVEALSSGSAASRLVGVQGATTAVRVAPAAKVPTVRVAVPQPGRAVTSVSRPRVAPSSEPVRQRIATELRALEEYERTQASLQQTHDGPVPSPSPAAPKSTP